MTEIREKVSTKDKREQEDKVSGGWDRSSVDGRQKVYHLFCLCCPGSEGGDAIDYSVHVLAWCYLYTVQ